MALKKCKECGNQVSTKADKCLICGAPVKRGTSTLAYGFIGVFFILIFFGSGITEGFPMALMVLLLVGIFAVPILLVRAINKLLGY